MNDVNGGPKFNNNYLSFQKSNVRWANRELVLANSIIFIPISLITPILFDFILYSPHAQQNLLSFMPKYGFDLIPGHGLPHGMW